MVYTFMDFPGGSDGKASVYNAGDLGSSPELGRSPGEGNSNPLQNSCLENPMDGGAWWATVHGVTKSQTWLSDFTFWLLSVTHSHLTLCNPMDCSPQASSVHEILQTRIQEWIAISFSRGSSQLRDPTCVCCVSCTAGRFFIAEPLGKP